MSRTNASPLARFPRRGIACLLFAFALAAPVAWRDPAGAAASAEAAVFVVDSTGDAADSNTSDGVCDDGSGHCTLRAAIQQSNASPAPRTIAFNIPGAGVHTIAPVKQLPTITSRVVIDGYTQPGASPNTLADGDNAVLLVELRGPGDVVTFDGFDGLTITAGFSTVRGLIINRFGFNGHGIHVTGSGNNLIEGNIIGTEATGAFTLSNNLGIAIDRSSNNLIGGTTPAARNLLSGNTFGISITNSSGNAVRGNFIGTNLAGTGKTPNSAGVQVVGGSNNIVGGDTPETRNVISGNSDFGVYIPFHSSFPLSSVTVSGNYIGTDPTGTRAVGNKTGIETFTPNVIIGGFTTAAGNLVSGNTGSGMVLRRGARVAANLIGTDASGVRPLGNGGPGIELPGLNSGGMTVIGPLAADAPGNVIAFNAGAGVLGATPGSGTAAFENVVRSNHIFSNGGLGIDLAPSTADGVTPNDGPNANDGIANAQNFPVINTVTPSGGPTLIQGTLQSGANKSYDLDFYTNSACDSSGNGEGARPFGTASVTTDAGGNAAFSVSVPAILPAGRAVTATATGQTPSRNTSEFSPCALASAAAGTVEFNSAVFIVGEAAGNAAATLVRSGGSAGALSVNFVTGTGSATAPSDYMAVAETVTFADGETTKTVFVPIINDGAPEPDEAVELILFNPTDPDAAGNRSRATLNIIDGSGLPSLSVSDVTVAEPSFGRAPATFTVSLSAPTTNNVSVTLNTSDNTANTGSDYDDEVFNLTFAPGETSKSVVVEVFSDTVDEPTETFDLIIVGQTNALVADGRGVATIIDNDTPIIQFSAASYNASEDAATSVLITVVRSGPVASAVTVDYASTDGGAEEREDYTTTIGTLRFAPGETTKTFRVLLTNDAFQEPAETVNLHLSNPTGGAALAGQTSAVLNIGSSDSFPTTTNPIDGTALFVRQHYHDFLGREPDDAGFIFWSGQLEACGADAACRRDRRVNVSAAFFLSIEFQRTGFFAIRVQRTAFGRRSDAAASRMTYRELIGDTRRLGDGVVVGEPGADERLEQNRQAYVLRIVTSAAFAARFPETLTANEYVLALYSSAGLLPTPVEFAQAVDAYGAGGAAGRAAALRKVAESQTLIDAEFRTAFVLLQYHGYLRRNPTDAPDTSDAGYQFWLTKLNEHGGDFVAAEMVKSFIVSTEYRARFGAQ